MLTALIITTTATTLVLAAVVLTIVTGWFPRLAALAVRSLEFLLWRGDTPRLDPRERSELMARLWVP
jgi:hypothetical protein